MEIIESDNIVRGYRMPFGDLYGRAWSQGDTLNLIAMSDNGVLSLNAWHAANKSRAEFDSVNKFVAAFLALADIAQKLQAAAERQQARKSDATKRRQEHFRNQAIRRNAERHRREDYAAHNLERGIST